MASFHSDPRNEAYRQLIDELIKRTSRFLLVDRYSGSNHSKQATKILQQLKPYLIDSFTYDDYLQGYKGDVDSNAIYGDGTYFIYRCCKETGHILKSVANRLSDWEGPERLEDLCFLDDQGNDVLTTIAHERIFGMSISDEEAEELMERIPGLFFDLSKHEDFDAMLDDAIKHRTDYLCIFGKGITALPARINKLTHLETLKIHEQNITTLPPELFELNRLKHLEIMVSDLAELPAEIKRLKSLRRLKLYNGTSFNPSPNWKLIPKEQLSMKQLPSEIGELRELEYLEIVYTALSDLPPELKKLTNLKHLTIGFSMIEGKPPVIHEMPWLKYTDYSSFFSKS